MILSDVLGLIGVVPTAVQLLDQCQYFQGWQLCDWPGAQDTVPAQDSVSAQDNVSRGAEVLLVLCSGAGIR